MVEMESIIRNIKYSPALEMNLKLVMRAISKAIMDVYNGCTIGEIKGETENQCFDRVAIENAKEYFEKMEIF